MASQLNKARVVAYHLGQQRSLPVLITDMIAKELDRQAFHNVGMVARAVRDYALAIFYDTIRLDFTNATEAIRRATLLCRTLLEEESLREHIKKLTLHGEPLRLSRDSTSQYGIDSSNGSQVTGLPEFKTDIPSRQYPSDQIRASLLQTAGLPTTSQNLLSLAPQLTHLEISPNFFQYSTFRDGFRRLVLSGHLDGLRSCSLCLDMSSSHISDVSEWHEAITSTFQLPKLETLKIATTLSPELPVFQALLLTSLELHHYQDLPFDLTDLFKSVPNLRHLKYHAYVTLEMYEITMSLGDVAHEDIGLGPVCQALQHVSNTLETLVLSQASPFDPELLFGLEPLHEEAPRWLASLPRLQELTIPFCTLLGWYPMDDQEPDWDGILPKSLRKLTWTDDLWSANLDADAWTEDDLMPIITRLLDWLVDLPHETPAQFALVLSYMEVDFDGQFNTKLEEFAAEKGIKCDIELHADITNQAWDRLMADQELSTNDSETMADDHDWTDALELLTQHPWSNNSNSMAGYESPVDDMELED